MLAPIYKCICEKNTSLKRCDETYVTPEISEMIDEVMKEHRVGKLQ